MNLPAGRAFAENSLLREYWSESRRPLACLAFVLPFLAIYEVGILWLGAEATRNGAEVYLRFLLESAGLGQYFLLPLLIGAILLGWHHASDRPWKVHSRWMWMMMLESLLLGFLILLLANAFLLWPTTWTDKADTMAAATGAATAGGIDQLISYFGAGIYEELLFRLMLLPATAAVIRLCGGSGRVSWAVAIVVTSLLFSAVHYELFTLNPNADVFAWDTFVFRALAGVVFSILFVLRGFGIAVGAHAMYDVFLVVFA